MSQLFLLNKMSMVWNVIFLLCLVCAHVCVCMYVFYSSLKIIIDSAAPEKRWLRKHNAFEFITVLSKVYPILHTRVSNSFSPGWGARISLTVAYKGPDIISGLYKCNCSLTGGKELYIQPLTTTARLMWPPVKMSLTPLLYTLKICCFLNSQ